MKLTNSLRAGGSLKRRNCLKLAISLMFVSTGLFADAFSDRVLEAFRRADPSLKSTTRPQDEIHLSASSGEMSVFLDHLRTECEARPDTCEAAIQDFAQRTVAALHTREIRAFNAENVFPVIRAEATLRSMDSILGSDPKKQFVSRAFVSGAVLVYVIDMPDVVRFVNAGDLDQAGLTPQALNALAISHVSKLAGVRVQPMEGAPGLWVALATDGYGTSRLFDPRFCDALEKRVGGPVAIALPTRDWILAVRLDDPRAIADLRALAGRIAAHEPYAVTSALVRRDGVGWSEIPP